MKHTPIRIMRGEFPKPALGKLVITINIKTANLHNLTSKDKGYRYCSKDEKVIPDATEDAQKTPNSEDIEKELDRSEDEELDANEQLNIATISQGEDVKKSIRAAYKMAGIRSPKKFTSMAARIQNVPVNNSDLAPYGEVVLVVDPREVREHLVVFSGDAKTLGDALLRGKGSHAKAWIRKSASVLAKQLRTYRQNRGRAIGRYFEARLLRALKVTDISEIYVPEDNDAAWEAANDIKELKLRKAENRRKRVVKARQVKKRSKRTSTRH